MKNQYNQYIQYVMGAKRFVTHLVAALGISCLAVSALAEGIPAKDRITPAGDCPVNNCVEFSLLAPDGRMTLRIQEWKKRDGTLHSKDKQAIIFIGGFPHSHLLWLNHLESKLADKFRLISFDARGQGSSGKPDEFEVPVPTPGKPDDLNDTPVYATNQNYAGDIQDIIDGFDLNNAVIVMHSWSGTIGTDYVFFNTSSDIGGVVFVAAFTMVDLFEQVDPTINQELFTETAMMIAPGLLADNLGLFIEANKQFAAASSFRKLPKEFVTTTLAVQTMSPANVRFNIFLRVIDREQRNESLGIGMANIPSMVVHGQRDDIIRCESGVNNFRVLNELGDATLKIYKNAGHFLHVEKAKRFRRDLIKFMNTKVLNKCEHGDCHHKGRKHHKKRKQDLDTICDVKRHSGFKH